MDEVMFMLIRCAVVFIDVLLLAMMLRAIMSWFVMNDGQNGFMNFLTLITEPVILPVRALCDRFGWFKGVPLDIPFLISTLLLSFISMILQNI